MTADSGELNSKVDPDQKSSPIKRSATNNIGNIGGDDDVMFADERPYRPDKPDMYDQSSFDDSFMQSTWQNSEEFINAFATAFFKPM